jgi:hypothetical protein
MCGPLLALHGLSTYETVVESHLNGWSTLGVL